MIFWFTGNSGSGKTTKAKRLIQDYTESGVTPPILLDGDEMREVWPGLGFSKKDRYEQNLRVAKMARALSAQGFDVVVATICPYRKLRTRITEICNPKFFYLSGGEKPSKTYPYEKE